MSGLAVPIYICMHIYIPAISDTNHKQTVARREEGGDRREERGDRGDRGERREEIQERGDRR